MNMQDDEAMNTADAAYKVLQEAGKPLHYAEIARRMLQSKLWIPSGGSPGNIVKLEINQEIAHGGNFARFANLGSGIYAAVPKSAQKDPRTMLSDLAFVSEAWGYLPTVAKQEILRTVRAALTGQTGEVDDPVIASVLPAGPKAFPRDFLDGGICSARAIELPEERLTFRQLADGACVVESHFGFRLDVRNETEGMFIVHAHGRGARTLNLPEKMIHIFKAVTGYRGYLRELWQDLYRAYGRECGDRAAAYNHAKTAFETLGLPPPDEAQPPPVAQDDEPGERRTRLKRGLRTPETAFYSPILQALEKHGGAAPALDVVKRVGEFMADALSLDDRVPLPSTGLPRWESTARFARYSMVRAGLLRPDSPRGTWEISAKGMEHLQGINQDGVLTRARGV
jgi:hypothetical protein